MSHFERLVELVRQKLVVIYACLAIPTGLFLAMTTPPLQTPDAVFHVYRAFQISNGDFVAGRVAGSSGGRVDAALVELVNLVFPMAAHADKTYEPATRAQANSVRWSGRLVDAEFPGSAIYPAYAYIPQAIAIRVGRALDLPVVRTYTLACVFDLLVSIALTCWAIAIARRTSLAIFAVGLLPCTLMLFSSVSDEVMMIPACFLLIAYADRFQHDNRLVRTRDLVIGGALATLCITARPPYAGMVLLAFMPGLRFDTAEHTYRLVRRLVAVIVTMLVSFGFIKLFSHAAWAPVAPPRSVSGQMQFLMSNPLGVPVIAWQTFRTWGAFYWASFVGILGWLDTQLHPVYYRVAVFPVLLAMLASTFNRRQPRAYAMGDIGVVLLVGVSCLAMIFGSLYLFWTPVGQMFVDGVQGRYFLGLAPLLALALPPLGTRSDKRSRTVAVFAALCMTAVVVFPVYSYLEVLRAILNRYYA
ncbi:DUF2142 domain-containing protein [Caballeronia insecticola]|uniref:DUF2142 domain-containing protein n=1 Tax=Caballeronia insecticola TaxID=758793 RepID=R4WZM8_9BURK|nr:DUF2142 domain-containing protein [Caballeronia insecticola]BAN23937.1 putative uncharacterized protein [Caballeronia insecticola]